MGSALCKIFTKNENDPLLYAMGPKIGSLFTKFLFKF